MWWDIIHLKKEILTHVTTWMKLEDITRSERSQSEKDQHHVIPPTRGFWSGHTQRQEGDWGECGQKQTALPLDSRHPRLILAGF